MARIRKGREINSKERLLATLTIKEPDRVPTAHMISQPVIERNLDRKVSGSLAEAILWDPLHTIIPFQERWGFDPLVFPFVGREADIVGWWPKMYGWPEEDLTTWRITEHVESRDTEWRIVRRVIHTPGGDLTMAYKANRYQKQVFEHALEFDTEKIELLTYRPNPTKVDTTRLKKLVETVGDRGLVMLDFPGVWDEACGWREQTRIATDVYDRPEWLLKLMSVLRDYTVALVERFCQTTGIQFITYNDTFVGMGISSEHYKKFVLPFARDVVEAAKKHGVLVGYHNCGRSTALLELMADTGADSIETLTPKDAVGGDVDPGDAKKRVGDRVCLFGGFNERVLANGTPEDVRAEVKQCIEAAAEGGRYILRACSQIQPDAKLENIQVIAEAVDKYGRY